LPKDTGHDHELIRDKNHTISEHCDNVIYNITVSNEHKCAHKYHLHAKQAHCLGCDNHCNWIHTSTASTSYFSIQQNQSLIFEFTLPLNEVLSSGIYNKGPPSVS
jgi:hypothetical protein